MKLSKKEMEAAKYSRDTQGVYKQYNPIKSRWEVRVLGRQMTTAKWNNWTRLLRVCQDEDMANQVLLALRSAGAIVWELDAHGQLVVKEKQ